MVFGRLTLLPNKARPETAKSAQGPMAPIVRDPAVQWTIVTGVVGILLGLYVLGVFSLPQRLVPLFILAMFCPFVTMILGDVRRLLLVVIILDIPFQLDTHLYYRNEVATLGALGGLSLSVTTICLAVLYALWLSKLLNGMASLPRHFFSMVLPLAVYLAFVILSVVVASDVSLALFKIALFLQTFLLYVYIIGTVQSRQDVLFIVMVLLISVVLESLLMIALYFKGQSFEFLGMLARIDRSMRVGGTVGSAINAAAFLGLLLPPAISIWFTQLGRSKKCIASLAFGLGVVALVLTLARGGWIGFVLSVTILCFLAWRRGWVTASFPIAIAVVAGLLFLLFHGTIIARLVGYDRGSAYSRIPLMKLAFRMTMDNPVLGVGSNNFVVVMTDYAKFKLSGTWLNVVHNKYLLVAAETGIGALTAFMWFLVATIRRGWQCSKSNDRFLSAIALGFTLAIIGNMIHMLVDIFHSRPDIQLQWLGAGLISAMYTIARDENSITPGGNS